MFVLLDSLFSSVSGFLKALSQFSLSKLSSVGFVPLVDVEKGGCNKESNWVLFQLHAMPTKNILYTSNARGIQLLDGLQLNLVNTFMSHSG